MNKILRLLPLPLICSLYLTNGVNSYTNRYDSVLKEQFGLKSQNSQYQSSSPYLKRYDDFENVDNTLLNKENDKFLTKINNIKNKDLIWSPDHKHNNKELLTKIFKNKLYLQSDERYQQFLHDQTQKALKLHQTNVGNYHSRFPHYPPNYTGVYFPWWTFGTTFYFYLSSYAIDFINKYLGWDEPTAYMVIVAFLVALKCNPIISTLLSVYLLAFFATFNHFVTNNKKLNTKYGIVMEIPTLFPIVTPESVWSQIDFDRSPSDSFEVDYRFFAPDDITICLTETSLNTLMNMWDFKNKNAKENTISFLKSLQPIDNTGLGGEISNQDYEDMYNAVLNNDYNSEYSSYRYSNVVHYVKTKIKGDFWDVDIQTSRGGDRFLYWENL